ncbi:hypothetical protein [Leuconostoc pseudomesenteroides]
MTTTIYYKLEQLPYGSTRTYASPTKDIVQKGGYPVLFEIYGKIRSRDYVRSDFIKAIKKRYGQDITTVDISVGGEDK